MGTTDCAFITGGACCRPVTLVSREQCCLSHPDLHFGCSYIVCCSFEDFNCSSFGASSADITHWYFLHSARDCVLLPLPKPAHLYAYDFLLFLLQAAGAHYDDRIFCGNFFTAICYYCNEKTSLHLKKNIYISIFNFHYVSKIRQLRKSFHEWSGHTATVCCAQQLLAACTVLNVVPLTLYLWRQIDFASVYYPLNLCCVTCQFSCGDYCFEWLQVTYLLSKLHLIVRKIIFLIADFDAKYYLGADI